MHKDDEHVKMRILQAAKKLSAARGFEATTIREICKEAHANISLVSYYYGGKEHLFEAMLQQFIPFPLFSEHIRQEEADPVKGIQRLVERLFDFGQQDPEISNILHQEFALRSERIVVIQKYTFPAWQLLHHYLHEGREQGIFHFSSLNQAFLQVMGSILFGSNTSKSYPYLPLLDGEVLTREQQLSQLTNYILAGIGYIAESDKQPL